MAATYSSLVGVQVGGKYEIRRVLGAGGMGVVCEAIHVDLGKRVAIKLIDKSMKESELIVARFRREARALGQIDSEHIVDVFDVGADGRVGLYMVMEYLTGEDLQERLERDKKIDVRTMVMIGHQVARALVKAHAAGVVHRDLKPANVFLTQRDTGQLLVKLLDFGVSKLVGDVPGDARITGVGSPVGTPLYMSPEQAEGKDDVDGRADIWSLGAVMFEALSGESAFKDRGSYHNTIIGILTSQPPPLHELAPWVPTELAAVVDAMLVHDRDKRIPDAAAVTKRLLDGFPGVLADGTGQHTAVIVPQSSTAVDATGDTEIFNSTAIPAAMPMSRPPPRESTATIGDYEFAAQSSRPKTMPLPPSSSFPGRFESVKITPSDIAPLPQTSSRSPLVLMTLLLAALGIGVGAYAAGKRAQIIIPSPTPSAAPSHDVVAPPPTPEPAASPPPAVSVSAAPAPSLKAAHKSRARPAKSAEPAPSVSGSPSAEPAPQPELPPTLD